MTTPNAATQKPTTPKATTPKATTSAPQQPSVEQNQEDLAALLKLLENMVSPGMLRSGDLIHWSAGWTDELPVSAT
jgi:hypothetical protein